MHASTSHLHIDKHPVLALPYSNKGAKIYTAEFRTTAHSQQDRSSPWIHSSNKQQQTFSHSASHNEPITSAYSSTNTAASSPPTDENEDSLSSSMASSSARAVIASKRAAQNRAAQRAFRQRRERYIKDLERRVKEMASWPEEIEHLRFENKHLKEHVSILLRQISALTSQQMTPPLSSASSAGSCDAAATNSSSSYHTYPAHPPVQHITQEPMAQMTVQQDLANYYQHIHPPPYNYDTLAEQETALFYHRDINMSVKNSTQQPPSYQHVSQQQQHNSWNMNDFNLDLPFAIM